MWIQLSLLFNLFVFISGSLTCIGDNSTNVDFWFLIKEPKGTSYLYTDNNVGLEVSKYDLNDTHVGALGLSVSQLWNSSYEYILFNDEPVGTVANSTTGHTKGIWIWNLESKQGLIITHSIPLFPVGPSLSLNYTGLGHNAYTYAQHMACFSTSIDDLNRLASLTILTVPGIYDTKISEKTPSLLKALASGAISSNAVCNSTQLISTMGMNLTYFAKSSQWNNELYAACIAPYLESSLYVESWIRGDATGPYCGLYPVYDAKNLSFMEQFVWKETQDHSKWAVGVPGGWVCPGDINRMTSQYGRGGSAYCFQNKSLANRLKNALTTIEICNKSKDISH